MQRGDTIIEVMFAIAVFALVAVGSISIMNIGTANSLTALETTAARQAIDSQVSALQLMHDAYTAQYKASATSASDYVGVPAQAWYTAFASPTPTVSFLASSANPTGVGLTTCPAGTDILYVDNRFIVDPTFTSATTTVETGANSDHLVHSVIYTPASAYPNLVFSGGKLSRAVGVWVEAKKWTPGPDDPKGQPYIDFYVNACWPNPSGAGVRTLGTIVRLYVPA